MGLLKKSSCKFMRKEKKIYSHSLTWLDPCLQVKPNDVSLLLSKKCQEITLSTFIIKT